jgi:hypothetical protein
MHQIDNAWTSSTKPPPQPLGTPGYFQPGNVSTQLLATVVDYDWANTIQSELINVITNAGLTPDKQNDAQLVASIINIVNREVGLVTGGPYLPLAGGVMGGTIYSNAAAGIERALISRTAGRNRWITALADNSAENGGNTGSDFTLSRCDDNGNVIDVVMRCHRYTGVVDFPMGMTYGSGVIGGGPGGGANLPTDPPTLTLNQDTTVYVDVSAGADNNQQTGTQTPGFKTLQYAWSRIRLWDLNGFRLTIQYTGYDANPGPGVVFDCRMYGQTTASQLMLVGNPNGQTHAIVNGVSGGPWLGPAIGAMGGAMATVGSGLRLLSITTTPTSQGPAVGLWAYGAGSQIVFAPTAHSSFGYCAYAHVLADGGTITIGAAPGGVSAYTFDTYASYTPSSQSHWHARNGGVIDLSAGMLDIGTPVGVTMSGAFAVAETSGRVSAPDTGNSLPWGIKAGITGSRYKIDATGSITNTGGDINYLPGNAVGTVAPGGIYA